VAFSGLPPVESLLPTLKELYLFDCKFDDLPSEICSEGPSENVLDEVRAHYRQQRPNASPKIPPTQPLGIPPQIFVSYAWGNISPNATEEDRQRQEVVERLCTKLEQERWNLIRDTGALDYGDQISTFMKTLGEARLVVVVLSGKYLRSPYCMTELHALYRNARQEKQEFLNRIIPLVLKDANTMAQRSRRYARLCE
jgi:TIR domain